MSSQLRLQSPTCHVRGLWTLIQNGIRHTIVRSLSSTNVVVISGVSCRLPSCDSFEEFGRNLRDGKDMVTEQTRFRSVRVPQRLGLLNEMDKFDAGFFKMPPRLADASDPQLRMLLEVVLETIVDAGINPQSLSGGNVGVFVAASGGETFDYGNLTFVESESDGYKMFGAGGFMIPNQISYAFNLKGTSALLSSGCSSSMVALESAVAGINEGRIDAALVAGCCVYLNSLSSIEFASIGALSPDGVCRAFDESANGFVRSEAVMAFLLQRQRDARRCRAVVRAVYTSHDGYKPQGLACPSSRGQIKLLENIYLEQVDPNEVTFLEAHGTATPVGDPEELEAIAQIFCRERPRVSPLLIGSVKSNLGHTETAAGLCSIAKVLTIFQSGIIPPNLNYVMPNHKCAELVQGALKVVSEPTPFSGGLVGISSLSIGGVNGHIVLEPWSPPHPQDVSAPQIMMISGRCGSGIRAVIENNIHKLENPEFHQILHSSFGNPISGHDYRGYGIVLDGNKDNPLGRIIKCAKMSPKQPYVWFVFSGLGSEVNEFNMSLMDTCPPFASSLYASDSILKEKVSMSLLQTLASDGTASNVDVTVGLVALIAVQIAFVDALRSIGIEPDGFLGYSAGEFACGYTDGCLTQEEALLLSYYEGESYKEANALEGSMASVSLSWDVAMKRCPPNVFPACKNAKDSVTISGRCENVKSFLQELKKDGIRTWEVQSHGIAPHQDRPNDKLFNIMRSYFEEILRGAGKSRSERWISTSLLQEQWNADHARSCSQYYVNNSKNPVLFYDALGHIPKDAVVLEIGLTPLLKPLIRRSVPSESVFSIGSRYQEGRAAGFFQCVGELYNLGFNMDLSSILGDKSYPVSSTAPDLSQLVTWDHTVSWSTYVIPYPKELSPTVRVDIRDPKWKFIQGHSLGDTILFPATGYLYLAWKVFADRHGADVSCFPIEFRSVNFRRMTVIDDTTPIDFQFHFLLESGQFEIREGGSLVVEGTLRKVEQFPEEYFSYPANRTSSNAVALSNRDFYREMGIRGYKFYDHFQSVSQATVEGNWADVEWRDNWITFLDGMLQAALTQVPQRITVVPVNLPLLAVDPAKFLNHVQMESGQELPQIRIFHDHNTSTTYAPGIVVGLSTMQDSRVKQETQEPVLLKEVFTPFYVVPPAIAEYAWWEVLDLVTENLAASSIGVLVVTNELDSSRWGDLVRIFEDQGRARVTIAFIFWRESPLRATLYIGRKLNVVFSELQAQLVKINPDEINQNALQAQQCSWDLVITDSRGVLDEACQMANNFVLLISDVDEIVNEKDLAVEGVRGFVTVAEKFSTFEKLTLLKKTLNVCPAVQPVEVTGRNFEWLLAIQKALEAVKHEPHPRIYLWTRDAEHECGLVGLVRCLRKEQGGENIRCFNDPEGLLKPCFEQPSRELKEILKRDLVINVCRDGSWGSYAHIPSSGTTKERHVKNALLCNPEKDGVSGTRWLEIPVHESENKQTVRVTHAGLNFHDILVANGTLSDAQNPMGFLGYEFSGYDFRGERVMGLTPFGALGTTAKAVEDALWKIPDHWTLEDAATVPVVYSTVIWGLLECGRLQSGQSVLVHSGGGGTGLAAIQVAVAMGCEVFTTVGTPEKVDKLLDMFPQLRRERIGSSRDTSFEKMVMTGTNGRGVDVALNSLTGDLVETTLNCIATCGRFIDLSASHMIHDTVRLKMRPFFNNVGYHGVVLTKLGENMQEARRLKQMVQEAIDHQLVVPLPRTVYPMEDATKALQVMQKGNHMGKLIVNMENSSKILSSVQVMSRVYFRPSPMYIVVGGLGGIGFELVNWLVERGARNVVILSRTAQTSGYHDYNLGRLKRCHNAVNIQVLTGDVADEAVCAEILSGAENSHGVAGIFISALVLKDGPVVDLTQSDFRDVYSPKAAITKNFDSLTRKHCKNVEYFVVFSSVVGRFGMEFQSNYGYASVVTDRICERRAKLGHHALAFQIGVVSDVGYVADKLFKGKTISPDFNPWSKPQTISSVLNTLEKALLLDLTVCSSVIPYLVSSEKAKTKVSLLHRVLKVMGLQGQQIQYDTSTKLKNLGLDSLSSSMIRQIIQREYKTAKNVRNVGELRLSDLIAIETQQDSD